MQQEKFPETASKYRMPPLTHNHKSSMPIAAQLAKSWCSTRTGWRTRLPSCGNKQVSPPGNKLPEKHSSCPKNRFHRLKTAPMQACRKATGFAKYGTGKSRQPTTWILAEKPLNPLPITSTTSVLRTPS